MRSGLEKYRFFNRIIWCCNSTTTDTRIHDIFHHISSFLNIRHIKDMYVCSLPLECFPIFPDINLEYLPIFPHIKMEYFPTFPFFLKLTKIGHIFRNFWFPDKILPHFHTYRCRAIRWSLILGLPETSNFDEENGTYCFEKTSPMCYI